MFEDSHRRTTEEPIKVTEWSFFLSKSVCGVNERPEEFFCCCIDCKLKLKKSLFPLRSTTHHHPQEGATSSKSVAVHNTNTFFSSVIKTMGISVGGLRHFVFNIMFITVQHKENSSKTFQSYCFCLNGWLSNGTTVNRTPDSIQLYIYIDG